MSLLGKLFLSLSGLSLIIIMSTSWILGGWLPVLYIFLVLFFLGIVLSLVIDYKLYLGFLLMRTTKNGMSMGVSVLITLIFCISLSYISVRFEKSMDITEEKINSLAPQTMQILKNLEEEMRLTVFYKGSSGAANQKKDLIKRNLVLFKRQSSRVKDRYYDAHLNNKLSQEYLNEIASKETEDIFVFTEYKGKRALVDFPFDEEKLTAAMIRVTRREERVVYFLSGHGERAVSNESGAGISELKEALIRSSFKVKDWNFIVNGALPDDVSALVIAGPQHPYMEKEIQWLEKYLEKGGRMLVALDPDRDHSLKQFLKKFGVHYKAHYIKDMVGAILGLGPFSPMGVYYDNTSVVTRSFQGNAASVFHLASDLEAVSEDNLSSVVELVKTNVNTFSVPDLKKREARGERSSHTLALLVEDKKDSDDEKNSEKKSGESDEKKKKPSMILAVFGDSDFLSNDFIGKGVNRDLILNTISYLVDESDLVSIRPRKLKATQLTLKRSDQMGIILFAVVLPILFFICSFIIWFRRREA